MHGFDGGARFHVRAKKVLALIPLNLDGFLFSADYQSGKQPEIASRVAANCAGWEKDHALLDRELEKVIRALRTVKLAVRNRRRQNSESRGRYMVSTFRRSHILV